MPSAKLISFGDAPFLEKSEKNVNKVHFMCRKSHFSLLLKVHGEKSRSTAFLLWCLHIVQRVGLEAATASKIQYSAYQLDEFLLRGRILRVFD